MRHPLKVPQILNPGTPGPPSLSVAPLPKLSVAPPPEQCIPPFMNPGMSPSLPQPLLGGG